MSICCDTEKKSAVLCPECGTKAREVGRITLEHLLITDRAATLQDATYYFCATPVCEAVYFSRDQIFHRSDLQVRVGLKETEDSIPVCYCFGYTERMIAEEIESTGRTTIPERIRGEVQAGTCQCEIKNPQGTCCLGNVAKAVKRVQARRKVCEEVKSYARS